MVHTIAFWALWTARSMFITAAMTMIFAIMSRTSYETASEAKRVVDKLFVWAVNAFCFSFIAFVGIITIICAVGLFQFTVFLFF